MSPATPRSAPAVHTLPAPASLSIRVVQYVLHQGMTPEELRAAFPHVSLAAIYDALAFYYDNRDEVDAESTVDAALDAERA